MRSIMLSGVGAESIHSSNTFSPNPSLHAPIRMIVPPGFDRVLCIVERLLRLIKVRILRRAALRHDHDVRACVEIGLRIHRVKDTCSPRDAPSPASPATA